MDRYLEERGKRELLPDHDFFESCSKLSQIIGTREITALIVKMYAELIIASREEPLSFDTPRNLPDLRIGYISNINESVKADRKETRAVLRAVKIAAWNV